MTNWKNTFKIIPLLLTIGIIIQGCKDKDILNPDSGATGTNGNGGVSAMDSVRYVINGTQNVIRSAVPGQRFFIIADAIRPNIIYSGPTFLNGNLYYSLDNGEFFKIGLLDKISWTYKSIKSSQISKSLYGDGVLILNGGKTLYALNESTGLEIWKQEVSEYVTNISIYEDVVIFENWKKELIGLSLKSGEKNGVFQ